MGLLAFLCELPFRVLLNIFKCIFKNCPAWTDSSFPTKVRSRGFIIPAIYKMLFVRGSLCRDGDVLEIGRGGGCITL